VPKISGYPEDTAPPGTSWVLTEKADGSYAKVLVSNLVSSELVSSALEPYVAEFTSAYEMADHTVTPALTGTFVPLTDEVEVAINWAGQFAGVAHISAFFAWNQQVAPGTALLTGQGFLNTPHVADTSYETVGSASSVPGTCDGGRIFRIGGLTPGTPVQWELEIGATGYSEEYTADDMADPVSGAASLPFDLVLNPENTMLAVSQYTQDRVLLLNPGNSWVYGTGGTIKEMGDLRGYNGPAGLCFNQADGFTHFLYVCCLDDDIVKEVDITTNQVTRSWPVTDPTFVTTAGGYLWVVSQTPATVTPINMSTGVAATAITVGGFPSKPVVAGDHIYMTCTTPNRVDRIHTGTQALESLSATGVGQQPVAVAVTPDATKVWVLFRGTPVTTENAENLQSLATSTFTWTGETGVVGGMNVAGTSGNDIAVSPTGKSIVAVSTSTDPAAHDLHTYVLPSKGVRYEYGNLADPGLARIVIGAEGDIHALEVGSGGGLHHFHAASLTIDPTDIFWGAHGSVTVTPATEYVP
jgi:hypothetical protein